MPHILVVDDDATVRSIVARMLAAGNFTVSTAAGGNEALAFLEQQMPDLILSDVQMPDMDGHALCREARLSGFEGPFVGMSGNYGGEGEFDRFITKPFQLHELIAAIERSLAEEPVG